MNDCPVCNTRLLATQNLGGLLGISCPRYGLIALNEPVEISRHMLEQLIDGEPIKSRRRRSRLSHILRRQQRGETRYAVIPIEDLAAWRLDDPLPTPIEQVDDLTRWVGDHQPSGVEWAAVAKDKMSAWLGFPLTEHKSESYVGIDWLLSLEQVQQLAQPRAAPGATSLRLRLTIPGWRRYQELMRGQTDTRVAFMAMKFGDGDLNEIVDLCFRGAVRRAGFELRLLSDRQGAGLIDDQLRVALRTARFVIADLTHRNNGAYWEAGFAEGLGKPVIYSCRKEEWDQGHSHFDTSHLVTIIWQQDNNAAVGDRLTSTIRATLPAEAKMTDD